MHRWGKCINKPLKTASHHFRAWNDNANMNYI
uniref:Uncharacterized protein n=1 Tax=Arundo donax TaxID=35708 RepID=A0A0A9AWG1_ARUDO